jgi:hypothetical protein
MAGVDIGESLVGAYLRHVVACDVVVYNSFFSDRQGEIDVVGLKEGQPRTVWLCEATTHTGGMLIVRKGKNATEEVIRDKLERLRHFAETTFPDEAHVYEWWSPRVSVGRLTQAMTQMEQAWGAQNRKLHFVINEIYTERIRELAQSAAHNSSTTNEPAYRMLQVLNCLRGGAFQV